MWVGVREMMDHPNYERWRCALAALHRLSRGNEASERGPTAEKRPSEFCAVLVGTLGFDWRSTPALYQGIPQPLNLRLPLK